MVGMLQVMTYLLAFYLVIKGVEILQIGISSARSDRTWPIALGAITLIACIVAGIGFIQMQDRQASQVARTMVPQLPQ